MTDDKSPELDHENDAPEIEDVEVEELGTVSGADGTTNTGGTFGTTTCPSSVGTAFSFS